MEILWWLLYSLPWLLLSIYTALAAVLAATFLFSKVFTENQGITIVALSALNAFLYTFFWGMGWF